MEFGPRNLTVLDGKDATLSCRAAGAPLPNTTWIQNGKILQKMKYLQMAQSNLKSNT